MGDTWSWNISITLGVAAATLHALSLFFLKPGVSALDMMARGGFVQPLSSFLPAGRKLMTAARSSVFLAFAAFTVYLLTGW